MPGATFVNDFLPELVGSAAELVGLGMATILTKRLPSAQEERGDTLMQITRELLQKYSAHIPPKDLEAIQGLFEGATLTREALDNKPSFKKFFIAQKYRRLSKATYRLTKIASDRIIDLQIWGGSDVGGAPTVRPSLPPPETATTMYPHSYSNPFTDSHMVIGSANTSVDNLSLRTMQTDMTADSLALVTITSLDDGSERSYLTAVNEPITASIADEDNAPGDRSSNIA